MGDCLAGKKMVVKFKLSTSRYAELIIDGACPQSYCMIKTSRSLYRKDLPTLY